MTRVQHSVPWPPSRRGRCGRLGQALLAVAAFVSLPTTARVWAVPLPESACPADSLNRRDVPAHELAAVGGGDPKKAPPELVAVLGNSLDKAPALTCVAVSRNGKWLATASMDKTVRLWDVGHQWWVRDLAFSPNGELLASASHDHTVMLWDVAAAKPLHTLAAHTWSVAAVAFSPDGKRLASGAENEPTIKLWDVATGKDLRTFEGHDGWVWGLAFSPDGKRLASAGRGDKTVKLWDPSSDKALHTLEGHTLGVVSVAISPNGRELASTAFDGTLRLWDVQAGKLLKTWTLAPSSPQQALFAAMNRVVFTPEGRHLVTANPNGTVYILRLRR